MADLFTLLDNDWRGWRGRREANDAFARWQTTAPVLADVRSLDDLLDVFEDRRLRDEHDQLMLALLSVADRDADAHRTVLRILRSGLVALATRANKWTDWDDASSMVITAAIDRLGRYPAHRTTRVVANLLGDIWHSVWAERQIELRRRTGWQHRVDLDDADVLADNNGEAAPGEELMSLIGEAIYRRRITPYDGRLVALHRVLGYSNVEVGRIEGLQACTIRKRRLAAEAAITALAVA